MGAGPESWTGGSFFGAGLVSWEDWLGGWGDEEGEGRKGREGR